MQRLYLLQLHMATTYYMLQINQDLLLKAGGFHSGSSGEESWNLRLRWHGSTAILLIKIFIQLF